MHTNDIDRLADLLEAYILHSDVRAENKKALLAALEIINENL